MDKKKEDDGRVKIPKRVLVPSHDTATKVPQQKDVTQECKKRKITEEEKDCFSSFSLKMLTIVCDELTTKSLVACTMISKRWGSLMKSSYTCLVCGCLAQCFKAFNRKFCYSCRCNTIQLGFCARNPAAEAFLLDAIDLYGVNCETCRRGNTTISMYLVTDLETRANAKFNGEFEKEKENRRGDANPALPVDSEARAARLVELSLFYRREEFRNTFVCGVPLVLPREHPCYEQYLDGELSPGQMANVIIRKNEELARSSFGTAFTRYSSEYSDNTEPNIFYTSFPLQTATRQTILKQVNENEGLERFGFWELWGIDEYDLKNERKWEQEREKQKKATE